MSLHTHTFFIPQWDVNSGSTTAYFTTPVQSSGDWWGSPFFYVCAAGFGCICIAGVPCDASPSPTAGFSRRVTEVIFSQCHTATAAAAIATDWRLRKWSVNQREKWVLERERGKQQGILNGSWLLWGWEWWKKEPQVAYIMDYGQHE